MTADPERRMSFWEHLIELRWRILISLAAIAVGAGIAFVFREWLYWVLALPLLSVAPEMKLNYFAPQETFFVYIRLAFFGGLVLAAPVVLWQAWAFFSPAFKPTERKAVVPVLPLVLVLFVAGVLFVYYVLLPVSLRFLLGFAPEMLEAELHQDRYFGFVTALALAGGLLFELPVVMGIMGYAGLVNSRWLWQHSGHALVVLMILAAIITPTGDAFNMLVLTAPLMLLYLAGIVVVWAIQRKSRYKSL